jgi:hypothetical protein
MHERVEFLSVSFVNSIERFLCCVHSYSRWFLLSITCREADRTQSARIPHSDAQ